jgi:L-tyrosine isonitrile synthase
VVVVFTTRAEDICNEFDSVSKNQVGSGLWQHIERFIATAQPIQCVLPAFPCKSPNTERKVLGTLPDKGEELALLNLEHLCCAVQHIHTPGCEIVIVSDGRVYADIVGVSDDTVTAYRNELQQMGSFPHLSFQGLEEFFPAHTHEAMRQRLVHQYGSSVEDIREAIRVDHDMNRLYCGLTRFLIEDKLWMGRSKRSIKKECKQNAIEMMVRSEAYSALIKQAFPEHIRLSIHPHDPDTDKFGINLIPGCSEWGTPWHGVMVQSGNKWQLMKRHQAERQKIVYERGRPSYFVTQ